MGSYRFVRVAQAQKKRMSLQLESSCVYSEKKKPGPCPQNRKTASLVDSLGPSEMRRAPIREDVLTTTDKCDSTNGSASVLPYLSVLSSHQPALKKKLPEILLWAFGNFTKVHSFINTFVARTSRDYCEAFVDLPLIHKVFSDLPFTQTRALELMFSPQIELGCFVDLASLVYFLTAVRLGSIQSNDVQPEMYQSHYSSLELLLSPCALERRPEVISAHLLLATFCNIFSKKCEFVKHLTLASALIGKMEPNAPERLKTAFKFLVNGSQLPLSSSRDVEIHLLEFCMTQFSITPETFCFSFPILTAIICRKYNGLEITTAESEKESKRGLSEMFECYPVFIISFMVASWFQEFLTQSQLSKASAEGLCVEIQGFISLVCAQAKLTIDTVPASTQADLDQINLVLLIVRGEFQNAKILLNSILKSTDFWALQTGYFLFGEVHVHRLHFLIAAAVSLKMEEAYSTFWETLALVFPFIQRDMLLPKCISQFVHSNSQSLCKCQLFSEQCNILEMVQFLSKDQPVQQLRGNPFICSTRNEETR